MRKTSILHQLLISLASIVVLVLLLTIVNFYGQSQQRVILDKISHQIMPRALAARDIEFEFLRTSYAARSYVYSGHVRESEAFERSIKRLHQSTITFDQMPQTPWGTHLYEEIKPLIKQYEDVADQAMMLRTQGNIGAATAIMEAKMFPLRRSLLAKIEEFSRLQFELRDQALAQAEKNHRYIILLSLAIGILFISVSVTLAWTAFRAIKRPMAKLVQASQALSKGNYSTALSALAPSAQADQAKNSRDELTLLSVHFSEMAQKLEQREKHILLQKSLSSALASTIDTHQLSKIVLQELEAHTHCGYGLIYVYNAQQQILEPLLTSELVAQTIDVKKGEGLVSEALFFRKARLAKNLQLSPALPSFFIEDDKPPQTLLAVPLIGQAENIVGVILLGAQSDLSDEEIDFLIWAGEGISISLQNALAHQKVNHLAQALAEQNELLAVQNEELQAQSEEIKSQGDELLAQNEELSNAMKTVRENEQRLQRLVQANLIGIGFWDNTGRIYDANSLFLDIVGYEHADIIKTPLKRSDFIAPEYQSLAQRALNEADIRGWCTPVEEEYIRADGTRIPVLVGIARLSSWGHEYASFVIDISAQKKLEHQLLEQTKNLQEADHRKDEFLAMLSHELRNPLGALSNALELLKHLTSNDKTVAHVREIMERQIRHQTRLLDDLLDTSRIVRGKIELRHQPLDLVTLVSTLIEDKRFILERENRRLRVELERGPAWVNGDYTRLEQILDNLLQNAVKFTGPRDEIFISLTNDFSTGMVTVTVSDTGVGIPASLLDRIFDPFVQGDSSLERMHGGLGLGLSLVKWLVELHRGKVTVRSDGPGKGATFSIILPLALPITTGVEGNDITLTMPPEVSAMVLNSAASMNKSRRVLVIDDNQDLAVCLKVLLQALGYEVEAAFTGKDGIETARRFLPEVVLCDIGMPELDGYAVAKRLRNEPALAKARLIAVSGYGTEDKRQQSQEAGFDLHLVKPVEMSVLFKILSN